MVDRLEDWAYKVGLTFPSCIFVYLFVSFGVYFITIRGQLGWFFINEKMARKARKKQNRERWNRSPREWCRAFVRWLFFLCYDREKQNIKYYLSMIFCYIYLFSILLFLIIWIGAFCSPLLKKICLAFFIARIFILDVPVMILLETLVITGIYSKKRKQYMDNW